VLTEGAVDAPEPGNYDYRSEEIGMTTITIQAVYRNGVLQPESNLDLPENTAVRVEVTPLGETPPGQDTRFGALPELAQITEADMAWAKTRWSRTGREPDEARRSAD
jgi:predicted DNA-binding antitoxin AbrB/MazE fold protein